MREFNISKTLQASVENVLQRRNIEYTIKDNKIFIDCSGEQFHKIVRRARMEKLQEERNLSVPLIHPDEINDGIVLEETNGVGVVYNS